MTGETGSTGREHWEHWEGALSSETDPSHCSDRVHLPSWKAAMTLCREELAGVHPVGRYGFCWTTDGQKT